MSLRRLPARPRSTHIRPAYPRALAVATAILVSGCAVVPGLNNVDTEGDIAVPFEETGDAADAPWDVPSDTRTDSGSGVVRWPDASPDGTAAIPFDTGTIEARDSGSDGDTNDSGEVQ